MIKKLIEYQVKNNVTDADVCSSIGISRKTYYNVRVEGKCNKSTEAKIEKFIEENGL